MSEQSRIERALALHASGLLTEASELYQQILSDEANHAEALHYLGVLQHQQGRSDDGLSLIQRALELDPCSATRLNDLGNVLTEHGDLAMAAQAFGAALAVDYGDANIWNNLGSVLQRQRRLDAAVDAYREAINLAPEYAPALNNLASVLTELGREDDAAECYCRAFVVGSHDGKPKKMLGIAYYRLGRIAEAAETYRQWLLEEPDNQVARHLLAACSQNDVPPRASDAYVEKTFDDYAENFDDQLVGKLSYKGPELIAGLLDGRVGTKTLDVLDGGCGTGLCGPVLAPYARHLIGVDLSARMLAKAAQRGCYDKLVKIELTDYLRGRSDSFELVAMADTLIYFGDIVELFSLVSRALRRGGLFLFTVETSPVQVKPDGFCLSASGRYRHGADYVLTVLQSSGFSVVSMEAAVLRREFGNPAHGLAFSAVT